MQITHVDFSFWIACKKTLFISPWYLRAQLNIK